MLPQSKKSIRFTLKTIGSLLFVVAFLLGTSQSLVVVQAQTPKPPEEPARGLIPESLSGIQVTTAQTGSVGIAWGNPDGPHSVYAWPYTVVQMGHVIQSYQNYSSGTSAAYFHHGIDSIAPNGTDVFTRSGGQVVNVENYNTSDLYWEVAILDAEGYVWQYHHIDKNTIPQTIKNAYAAWQANHATGGFVPANTYIGDIVYWTVTSFGYRFNHTHINILGAGDVYLNPLEFMTPLNDTQAPEIQAIGLLNGNTLVSGNVATGTYGLYVRARDLFLSTVYYLPPYKTEFSMDGGAWTTVWEFDDLPGGASDTAFVNDFFVPVVTKGDYNYREFYIDLGFTPTGQRVFPSTPGTHSVQVRVWDYNGNVTTSEFNYMVGNSIPDNGCATGNGVTRTFNVTEDLLVTDINLGINVSHASRGQLKVTLKAPGDATATTIVTNSTDTYDNYDVLIDDGSSNALNDGSNDTITAPYFERTAGPNVNGSLNLFNGKAALGTWTVFVCDAMSGTTGTLNQVRFDLTGDPVVVNTVPVANEQSVSTDEDTAKAITLTGSDADGDVLTYSVVTNPVHGTLSGTGPNRTYTPAANYFGADSFTFKVNDGRADSPVAVVSLTVNAVNDAPVADAQSVSTNEDIAKSITLTGADVDGDALNYIVLTSPSHGTLSGTAPNIIYTPEAGFTGEDAFTFVINDGLVDSDSAVVDISVNKLNHPPEAAGQTVTVPEDENLAITLSGSDIDGDELSFIINSEPSHGTLAGTAPNLVYTPTPNFNGQDSISFLVNDGISDSNLAVITILVTPVNDTPAALVQSISTVQDTSVDFQLTGTDIDGDALTFIITNQPEQGILSGVTPNLTYTPFPGFFGEDEFGFVVNDGFTSSAEVNVSITVTPAGPITVFWDNFETNQGWVRNSSGTDTATLGVWERANPELTSSSGTKQMGTTVSGTYDLVTGPLAGSNSGSYDIDGGVTTIRSPNIALPTGRDLVFTFRYYLAHGSNSSTADYLRVKIVGASTSIVLQELGAKNDDDAVWASFSGNLNSFAGQMVYILIEAADASGASLVEAAIDDILIIAQ